MHVRKVTFAVTAAVAAGLALTACGGSGGGAGAAAPPASAPPLAATTPATTTGGGIVPTDGITPTGKASPAPAAAPSGAARPSGSAAGTTATPAGARCTAADLEISLLGPELLADAEQPAYAALHVVNTSARTCTLTGFPGIQVTDDSGRTPTPLTADRDTGFPATAVTLKPKQLANANLEYSDVNTEGSASGRRTCGLTASRAQVILPDETQPKQVKVTGGVDNNTLNICGKLSVQPFQGVPGVNA
ncbi:DUF4232 domain-containing protein [Kitasatospora sp. NPDC057223]|uniref:DUF4232 domain-containing protein n=1 Tax=Kitasatospora sp. NPDC057223 TaxID=3346055 RepID=UPI0036321ECB